MKRASGVRWTWSIQTPVGETAIKDRTWGRGRRWWRGWMLRMEVGFREGRWSRTAAGRHLGVLKPLR